MIERSCHICERGGPEAVHWRDEHLFCTTCIRDWRRSALSWREYLIVRGRIARVDTHDRQQS